MSGSFTDYTEAKVLAHVFGATVFTPPTTYYLALFTVAPSDAGGGTEATGSGYARQPVTNNTTNFPAPTGTSPTTTTNGVTFTMPTATGDWSSGSNMAAWALFDASSGGNMIIEGTLTTPKPVLNGDTMSFPASSMVFTLD